MPELPEVEITMRKLRPLVVRRQILYFWTDWPRGLTGVLPATFRRDIVGRTIISLSRHGKVIFFNLSGTPQRVMAIHLRMSGRLEIVKVTADAKAAHAAKERRWTHFIWRLGGGRALHFIDSRKFGRVWYGSPAKLARHSYLGRLGPDAGAITRPDFIARFRHHRGAVKPALLRQDIIAGVGNIIADESLWRARIHPHARLEDLTPGALGRLRGAVRQTIRAVLAVGGTSLRNWGHPDGAAGGYQEQRLVYGRAGAPCPRCRRTLMRTVVGGRGTTLCPRCQQ